MVKSDCLSQTLHQLCRGLIHRSLLTLGRATESVSAEAYAPALSPRGSLSNNVPALQMGLRNKKKLKKTVTFKILNREVKNRKSGLPKW